MTALRTDHVAVVVNTGSRRGADALAEVTARLHEVTGRLDVLSVPAGGDVGGALASAAAEGPDLLVVGGGDGTVGCAAGLVAGSGTVLGVLPLGTANDFARTLQIPFALDAAVSTLTHGKVVDIDLGRVEGWPFLNVASVGLSVGVTQHLSPRLKRRLGPAAYPAAALAAYRHHRPFAARLEFPDGDQQPLEVEDLLQISIGNGRHFGGGNTVSPTASLDDHLLDVHAVVRGRLRDHVSIARLLRTGHLVEHDLVHHVTTQRLRLVTDEPMRVNLDGEVVTTTPAEFTLERNTVHVVVPVHSTAAQWDGAGH
ncbi:lipid kinase [Nocardioides gansuensis]|uniref:Lipid kinase n=1 Tax=Nocardioides gansuensis TaxID=2138300 RepID=A0A2T8FB98_9ACTN|nr:lipid kinase [Nocardioides gansuensis]PVG82986.1 lipid kinase [Nocardioides gansuensis]